MTTVKKCETCMSSFISLLLTAANLLAISLVVILSTQVGLPV